MFLFRMDVGYFFQKLHLIFVPPEQGDGRGGGEGEAERPMAAFGQTLSLIYVRVFVFV